MANNYSLGGLYNARPTGYSGGQYKPYGGPEDGGSPQNAAQFGGMTSPYNVGGNVNAMPTQGGPAYSSFDPMTGFTNNYTPGTGRNPYSTSQATYSPYTGQLSNTAQVQAQTAMAGRQAPQQYAADQAARAKAQLASVAPQRELMANSIEAQRNAPTQAQLLGAAPGWGLGSGVNMVGGLGGVGGGQFQPIQPPSTAAYDNAAFGAAKARAGQLGQSALTSLQGQLADRGLLGSGVEARGLVDTLAAATNPLSDVNVAQLGQNINIGQHAQDLATQAGLTQRGQDIGLLESQNNIAAQQAIAQQNQQQQLLRAALSGLGGAY